MGKLITLSVELASTLTVCLAEMESLPRECKIFNLWWSESQLVGFWSLKLNGFFRCLLSL